MPETYTAATGTWTEEEIRQQPACWIRSLNNIDNIRSAIDSFLRRCCAKTICGSS
jgi:tagatose-6-phosphate ketose/aldose isomerase